MIRRARMRVCLLGSRTDTPVSPPAPVEKMLIEMGHLGKRSAGRVLGCPWNGRKWRRIVNQMRGMGPAVTGAGTLHDGPISAAVLKLCSAVSDGVAAAARKLGPSSKRPFLTLVEYSEESGFGNFKYPLKAAGSCRWLQPGRSDFG